MVKDIVKRLIGDFKSTINDHLNRSKGEDDIKLINLFFNSSDKSIVDLSEEIENNTDYNERLLIATLIVDKSYGEDSLINIPLFEKYEYRSIINEVMNLTKRGKKLYK